MITITPLHHPHRSQTRSSDALIHDVRPDDVLDAHAQLRRLVEQDVVVDERHTDPRGNRDPRVGALAVTPCPRAKLAPNGVPDRRVAARVSLVQVEEQRDERASGNRVGEEGEAIYNFSKHSASDDAGVSVFRPYQDPAPWMQETVNRPVDLAKAEHFLVCLTHASKLGSAFGRQPRWSPTEGWEAQGRSPRSV